MRKCDFLCGAGSIGLFPPTTEYKPVCVEDACMNGKKSFSAVAEIMNSVLMSEAKKVKLNAKA